MSELSNVIRSVCEEKGLKYEDIILAIESSLAAAYRKDYGNKNQNIKVKFNPETGGSEVEDLKIVVEDLPEDYFEKEDRGYDIKGDDDNSEDKRDGSEKEEIEEERKFNFKTDIQLSDAQLIEKKVKIGDEIRIPLKNPEEYGRIASQTAKQVIVQKIREMERVMIFDEFKEKEHEVINGVVQRYENGNVLVDIGKTIGIMPYGEQVPGEQYNTGDKIRVYVKSVTLEARGPVVVLSRISEEIAKALFYMEIPELASGMIELKAIARTAGSRLKVAVSAEVDNIDPIGSCVGQRGTRIQTIISELNGEKIDIIEYNDDISKFIANALSPAKVVSVKVNDGGFADVVVADDQFSLAIGKRGENIRLASALTGYTIKIYNENEQNKKDDDSKEKLQEKDEKEVVEDSTDNKEIEDEKKDKKKKKKVKKDDKDSKEKKVEKKDKK